MAEPPRTGCDIRLSDPVSLHIAYRQFLWTIQVRVDQTSNVRCLAWDRAARRLITSPLSCLGPKCLG